MADKVMSLHDAVQKYLHNGDSFTIGGITAREPVAAVYEIIRQGITDLTLVTATNTDTANMLLGAGLLKKIEAAYIWIGVIGTGLNMRRAIEKGIPRYVELEEYSNYGASCRFLAGAMDVPFMPIRSMLGTDFLKVNPNIKVMDDPYTGEKIALVPAAKPDVAFIHVQEADAMGNAQIWGITANDINIARAAKKVVLTCERIVPTKKIRQNPNATAIPHYCVDAVVEAPYCSHPQMVAGEYWNDIPFRRNFMVANKTQEGFEAWVKEWVIDVKDHDGYLKKLGKERLDMLSKLEHDNNRIPVIEPVDYSKD